MKALRLVPLLIALSCEDDDEETYVLFNSADDSMVIYFGSETMASNTIDLTSTTGDHIVGQATVDPQGGPCGTEHSIIVVIDDEFEDQVDRVALSTDSGERGEDEYDLEQDSADEGYYKLLLRTAGEPGETREDILTFKLYEIIEDSG